MRVKLRRPGLEDLILLVVLGMIAAIALTGCRPDSIVVDRFHTDTLIVEHPAPPARVDTLITEHVDTITVSRTDTLIKVRVDTVVQTSPPIVITHYDTTIVQVPVIVYVPRTDTLYLPSVVVHDSSFIYLQTPSSNPLAGGDTLAGLAYLTLPNNWGAIVFWHGHFTGVVQQQPATGKWAAYLYLRDSITMPWRGTFDTLDEAVRSLVPIVIVIKVSARIPVVAGGSLDDALRTSHLHVAQPATFQRSHD